MSDPVSDGLNHAIDQWLDIEGSDFPAGRQLENLWIQHKGVAVEFQPDGVFELIDKIQDEPAFRNCQRAEDLEPGHFGPGRIVTKGHLFDHLRPCE